MYNPHDVQVEQQIAQERYQGVVRARQVERAYRSTAQPAGWPHYQIALNQLGQQLVRWGENLQRRYPTANDNACC